MITISQITNSEELLLVGENGLFELYQNVFSEPPYEEFFSSEEVRTLLNSYIETPGGVLFLATRGQNIVGFGAAIPLANDPILTALLNELIEPNKTLYMADLGVTKQMRNLGIGSHLIDKRIAYAKNNGYDWVLMRTNTNNYPSQSLYRKRGFTQLDIVQMVKQVRTGGSVQTDTRIFLAKKLT